jgi:microcystin-dependent protein
LAFSGSGSATTRAHTHDSTIVNDGGSLNLDNITQGGAAMTTGAITYSDGAAGHMQVLTLGNASDTLQVNAGATAPEWVAGSDPHGAGMMVCWAGTAGAVPAGWLLCDGSSIATATYPDLHTAIGYVYGGAGANFNLPNLVNRFVRGQSTQTAATGGADDLTLTEAQMPTHTHTVTDPGHRHGSPHSTQTPNTVSLIAISGSTNNRIYQYTTTETTGITNANTGGSTSFDNRPAYIELMYIIKT